jgi:hypothetical protein
MDGHLHSNSTLIDVQIAGFKFEKKKKMNKRIDSMYKNLYFYSIES